MRVAMIAALVGIGLFVGPLEAQAPKAPQRPGAPPATKAPAAKPPASNAPAERAPPAKAPATAASREQDERAIRQICLNLLGNAIKFTPPGGDIWLKVGWTASGGQYMSVKDSGPGIPDDEIPIVLSSFGQGSNSIKSAEQGAGLGLPIAKSLVDLHSGTFTFRSKVRIGTEVVVTFPPERVEAAVAPLGEAAPPTQPTSSSNKPRAAHAHEASPSATKPPAKHEHATKLQGIVPPKKQP